MTKNTQQANDSKYSSSHLPFEDGMKLSASWNLIHFYLVTDQYDIEIRKEKIIERLCLLKKQGLLAYFICDYPKASQQALTFLKTH